MALFGKKDKVEKEKKVKKQPIEKATKPSSASPGGSGLLKTLGIEKDSSDAGNDKDNIQLQSWWQYLRGRIDQGARQYFENGSTELLEDLIERPLLDQVVRHLQGLKSQNLVWLQPKRKSSTEPRFRIFGIEKTGGKTTSFRVRESFSDHSQYIRVEDGQIIDKEEARGNELTLEAEVVVLKGSQFRLVSVTSIPSV
jgi:hypothetical protein